MPHADYTKGVMLSFEGEVYGELLFDALAQHEGDREVSRVWSLVAEMERVTRDRLELIARRHELDLTEPTSRGKARAREGIEMMLNIGWLEVVEFFLPRIPAAFSRYTALQAIAPVSERADIGKVLAHSQAFGACMHHLQAGRKVAAANCIDEFLQAR